MGHRVQSDERETERRNLAWVGQSGGMPTEQDHREWMAEEIPFQADPRPWERADLIVASALDRARIAHPDRFTDEFVFRRCPRCGGRNVVKEGDFTCAICDGDLPRRWNFDPARKEN